MDGEIIYFLDTNAASAFGRRRNRKLVELIYRYRERLRLSSVVWAELEYGAYKRAGELVHRERLVKLREHIVEVEPFDEVAAALAGRLRAMLEKRGERIGELDCLIAAHALSRDAIVVTHNVDEFARVPGLRVEDWESLE